MGGILDLQLNPYVPYCQAQHLVDAVEQRGGTGGYALQGGYNHCNTNPCGQGHTCSMNCDAPDYYECLCTSASCEDGGVGEDCALLDTGSGLD